MPFQMTLPVRYHQQDGTHFCGPACAQMVLDGTGAGLLDQVYLEGEIDSQPTIESDWTTSPDQLAGALNNNRSPAFLGSYALWSLDSKDALGRKIVWSLHHYGTPVIALVYGRGHWLVVNGFEASAAPTGPDDTSYSITSLDLRNPTPIPASPPPPHSASDVCGSDDEHGFTDEHVPYFQWECFYLYAVGGSSHWAGKFLAVCDSDPPPSRIGLQAEPAQRMRGDQIILPDRIGELAIAGLKRYGLDKRKSWSRFLAETSPGRPMLVQRLDRRDTFYYIVPMKGKKKAIPVLVCVDARFGHYQQAARISDPGGNALANLNFDPKAILSKVLSQPIDLGRRGKIQLRAEGCVLYPTLVWRPCRESMSPYLPFFLVISGDLRIYVHVDGRVFTKLHTRDYGN